MGRYVNPNAIVLGPADAEKIDLAKDGEAATTTAAPQAIVGRALWGVPVVGSKVAGLGHRPVGRLLQGGDLGPREATVTMTDSHEDYFVRNMVAVLAEERLAFAVTRFRRRS